jgi:hypothetical protein
MTPIGDLIKPKDAAMLRSVINLPAYSDMDICTICAIAVGCKWPLNEAAVFSERSCAGCGRKVPTTKVKNWTWE